MTQRWEDKERRLLRRWLEDYGNGRIPSIHRIGIIDLPTPTEPHYYYAFPSRLSSKQRKMVHQECVRANLFHCSVDRPQRHVRVSLYADGLPPQDPVEPPQLVRYRPWLCRKDRTLWTEPSEEARPVKRHGLDPVDVLGLAPIEHLIDHPEDCWRDGIDTIDLDALQDQDLSTLAPPSDHWLLVDTPEALELCAAELRASTQVAFDVEAYNPNPSMQQTCLLQLSNGTRDFVVDPLALWDEIGPSLGPIFADPGIVKIGHSIGGLDVRCLHRDFGIFVVNVWDTYEACDGLGLAALCRQYGGEDYQDLKDVYQTCDWRQRPLTEDMLRYARCDVHSLIAIRQLQLRDLAEVRVSKEELDEAREVTQNFSSFMMQLADMEDEWMDDGRDSFEAVQERLERAAVIKHVEQIDFDTVKDEDLRQLDAKALRMQARIMRVVAISQERCRDLKSLKESPHKNATYRLLSDSWTAANQEVYEALIAWRLQTAASYECLPGHIASLEYLTAVAWQLPNSSMGLRRVAWETGVLDEEGLLRVVRSFRRASKGLRYYKREQLWKKARTVLAITTTLTVVVMVLRRSRRP